MPAVPPMLRVACTTGGCPAHGVVRRVRLRMVALGVVEAPPLLCAACRTAVKVVSTEQEGQDMPKITRRGGASNAADQPEPDQPPADPAVAEDEKGGERSSRGSSSQASSGKSEQSEKQSSPDPQRRARTTGSRSSAARTGSSTARGTGGDRTDDEG